MESYKMKFYDKKGNSLGWVKGLTIDEVNTIYNGCTSILYNETGKVFNAWMPTVWDEKTGERVAGY